VALTSVLLSEMTWKEAEQRIKDAKAVILPLGSTEQHGYHMTLNIDSLVAEYISKEIAKRTNSLVLPPLNYGQVRSAKDFPATISIGEKNYISFIKDIVKSLENNFAKNIILFSGHWGNVAPIKIAVRELKDEMGFSNVYYLSYMNLKKYSEGLMESELWNGSGFHSGEIETSIALYVCPKNVNMEQAVCEYPIVPPDIDNRPIPWRDFAVSGVFGDATKATVEKGEQFIEKWINDMVQMINNL